MIRSHIQFGDEPIIDLYDHFNMIHLESDETVSAPTKDFESTSYAEDAAEHVYPKTTLAPFDYTVKLLVYTGHRYANGMIDLFNKQLWNKDANGNMVFREVTFYNEYKRVMIVGIPKPITKSNSFTRRARRAEGPQGKDVVEVEFTIHVADPTKCKWNVSDAAWSALRNGGSDFVLKVEDDDTYEPPRPYASVKFVVAPWLQKMMTDLKIFVLMRATQRTSKRRRNAQRHAPRYQATRYHFIAPTDRDFPPNSVMMKVDSPTQLRSLVYGNLRERFAMKRADGSYAVPTRGSSKKYHTSHGGSAYIEFALGYERPRKDIAGPNAIAFSKFRLYVDSEGNYAIRASKKWG